MSYQIIIIKREFTTALHIQAASYTLHKKQEDVAEWCNATVFRDKNYKVSIQVN